MSSAPSIATNETNETFAARVTASWIATTGTPI